MAIVVEQMIAALHDQRLAHPNTLLFLYGRACYSRQETEVRGYAWDCLTLSYRSIVKHGEGLSTDNALSRLIDYHHAASREIGEHIRRDFYHISTLAKSMWQTCSSCNINQYSREPKWWRNNLASSLQEICTNGPRSGNVLCGKQNIYGQLCRSCLEAVFRHWDSFEEEFNKDLDERARKLYRFTLSFLGILDDVFN